MCLFPYTVTVVIKKNFFCSRRHSQTFFSCCVGLQWPESFGFTFCIPVVNGLLVRHEWKRAVAVKEITVATHPCCVGAQADYERIEFDAKYYLPLYALRALYFRAGGGFYTRRSNNCFLDYDYFRNSYMPEGWEDEMSGQFQLLDSRWYNESRHYARLSAAYESPMLLFSRLKFLTKIVQKERVYLNLLHVNKLGYYGEWGYGLSTPILDAAVFVAVAGHKQAGIGGKVAFRLFDD